MAFSHGKSAQMFIDDVGGSERNFSTYINDTGLTRELDTADTSALGDTHRQFITGLVDGSFDLSGHYDPTVEGYINGLIAASQATQFKYFPAGSASGKTYYDGTAVCTSFNITTGIDDAASFTSAWKVSNRPTFGTA